jgi:hypothetical protein
LAASLPCNATATNSSASSYCTTYYTTYYTGCTTFYTTYYTACTNLCIRRTCYSQYQARNEH